MFFASVTDVLGLSEPQDGSSSETHEMSEHGLKQEMMSVSPPLHCVGGGGVITPAGCLKLGEAFREAEEMLWRIVYASDMWGPMCHILSSCLEYLSSCPESAV